MLDPPYTTAIDLFGSLDYLPLSHPTELPIHTVTEDAAMLFSMLQEAVRGGADRIALAGNHGRSTYGQLADSVRASAHTLLDHGVGVGTRLLLITDDAAQFASGFLAAASLGAVVTSGWPEARTGGDDEQTSLEGQAEFALLAENSTPAQILRARSLGLAPIVMSNPLPAAKAQTPRMRQTGPVTAEPTADNHREVLRSQANLVHEASSLTRALELHAGDRIFTTLPIEHGPGLPVALLASICSQATLACCPSPDVGTLRKALQSHKPTVLITDLPTLASQMIYTPHVLRVLKQVRLIVAPRCDLLPEVIEARASFSGRLVTFYYRAEAGVIALNNHGGTLDCVGRPLPGVRVYLEKAWDPQSPLPARRDTRSFGSFVCMRSMPRIFLDDSRLVKEPGVPGQLVIESPAAAPAATLNGRLYTPDLGYFDPDGELHVLPGSAVQSLPQARCA